jgi:tetratricopeptide (TPR) repeat protein
VQADHEEGNEDYNLGEVAFWIGSMAMDFNASAKKPNKSLLVEIRDRFSEIGRYDKAVEANRRAIGLDPSDDKLIAAQKDLEALRYTMERKEVSKTLDNVKDKEAQEQIQRQLSTHGGGDANRKLIESRRAEYEDNPDDIDKLNKLVDALIRTGEDDDENDGIKLLQQAYEKTSQYRHKVRAGDIRMKQHQRVIRNYKQFVDAAPGDEEYRKKYEQAVKARLDFELGEYADRVKNYPTDLRLKYELGRRQYQAGQIDEAIGSLQQATGDPKSRSGAHLLLGKSFLNKGWTDEAINTMEKGLEQHEVKDDPVGKELQYDIMLAYLMLAEKDRDAEKLKTAQQYASALLQADIGYRDIRDRMGQIRKLSESLSA